MLGSLRSPSPAPGYHPSPLRGPRPPELNDVARYRYRLGANTRNVGVKYPPGRSAPLPVKANLSVRGGVFAPGASAPPGPASNVHVAPTPARPSSAFATLKF